jgi:hypothetical protein
MLYFLPLEGDVIHKMGIIATCKEGEVSKCMEVFWGPCKVKLQGFPVYSYDIKKATYKREIKVKNKAMHDK